MASVSLRTQGVADLYGSYRSCPGEEGSSRPISSVKTDAGCVSYFRNRKRVTRQRQAVSSSATGHTETKSVDRSRPNPSSPEPLEADEPLCPCAHPLCILHKRRFVVSMAGRSGRRCRGVVHGCDWQGSRCLRKRAQATDLDAHCTPYCKWGTTGCGRWAWVITGTSASSCPSTIRRRRSPQAFSASRFSRSKLYCT